MTISKGDMQKLREALEAERAKLESELAARGTKETSGNWQGTARGFEENEADPIDGADKMEELATNIPLVEGLEQRQKDVVVALKKMDAGTYGICEKTGEEIPLERLRANPAARTIVEKS